MLKPLLLTLFVPALAPAQFEADAGQTIRLLPMIAIDPFSLAENATVKGTIDVASPLVGVTVITTTDTTTTLATVNHAVRRSKVRARNSVTDVSLQLSSPNTSRRALVIALIG